MLLWRDGSRSVKKLPETNRLLFNYKIFCAFDVKIFLQLFLYFAKLTKISQEETIAQEMRNLR